jgi:hypothetical protein
MDRTIIVVSHAIELEPLARGLVELGHAVRQVSVRRLQCTVVDSLGLICAVGGHGKAQCGRVGGVRPREE